MFSAWVKLRESVLWVDVHASETLATLEGMLNAAFTVTLVITQVLHREYASFCAAVIISTC